MARGKAGSGQDLHIWQVRVGEVPDDTFDAARVLSPMELSRCTELGPTRARPYLVGRTALRAILGEATGRDPAALRFRRRCAMCGATSHGKPVIADSTGPDFSIAYSDQLVLVAVSSAGPVGVDVEAVAAEPAVHRWTHAPAERAFLDGLTPAAQVIEATRSWVRKESVAKACGRGLSFPLAELALTGPRTSWKLPHRDWRVEDLPLEATPGTSPAVGAVARERGGAEARLAVWSVASTGQLGF